jgi:CyaY protein
MTVDTDPSHPHPAPPSAVSDADYHRMADEVIAVIEARIDRWLQDDVIDIDAQRTGGMLEMTFPNGSKIVVNKQPPLHEIWLAARSGGYHYKPVAGAWRDSRAGREFFDALSECASQQAGVPLLFER